MMSRGQIRERTQEICADLAALMIEMTSCPLEQSATLEEIRVAYGHAERILVTLEHDEGRD